MNAVPLELSYPISLACFAAAAPGGGHLRNTCRRAASRARAEREGWGVLADAESHGDGPGATAVCRLAGSTTRPADLGNRPKDDSRSVGFAASETDNIADPLGSVRRIAFERKMAIESPDCMSCPARESGPIWSSYSSSVVAHHASELRSARVACLSAVSAGGLHADDAARGSRRRSDPGANRRAA